MRRAVVRLELLGALVAMAGLALAGTASADTLEEAISQAYRSNPRLMAERAAVRALDEEVARANSGFRPTISASFDSGWRSDHTDPESLRVTGQTRPQNFGINADQSIFSGFRTLNAVREAEAGVGSGRATLIQVEQSVLLDTVAAYMSVLRDTRLAEVRRKNVEFLTQELAANKRRLAEGHVTRTDVLQTAAQRAAFLSQLEQASGNLRNSIAAYERVVGRPPANLKTTGPRKLHMPTTLEEALEVGNKEHPAVVAAVHRELAARHAIARIRGELLPSAHVQASVSRQIEPSVFADRTDSLSVRGVISMPLYSGGEIEARVRQAKHNQIMRLEQLEQVRQEVRAQVTQAWTNLSVARRRQETDRQQVIASQDALAGMRREERAGQRSVNDVLNAQVASFNAQAALVSTEYDIIVASYALLSAVGRLTMSKLTKDTVVYDPQVNYDATHRRWFGLTITYPDGRRTNFDTWRRTGYEPARH